MDLFIKATVKFIKIHDDDDDNADRFYEFQGVKHPNTQ